MGADSLSTRRNITSNRVPAGIVGAKNSNVMLALPVADVVIVTLGPAGVTNVTNAAAAGSAADHGETPAAR